MLLRPPREVPCLANTVWIDGNELNYCSGSVGECRWDQSEVCMRGGRSYAIHHRGLWRHDRKRKKAKTKKRVHKNKEVQTWKKPGCRDRGILTKPGCQDLRLIRHTGDQIKRSQHSCHPTQPPVLTSFLLDGVCGVNKGEHPSTVTHWSLRQR